MKNNTAKSSQGDNQNTEPKTNGYFDIEICPDTIKRTRKALGLTVDHFAWLFGVSPSSIFRYENTGVPTVHHGTLTRKLHLLNFWLNEPKSAEIMRQLLMIKDGLPTLSGLLEMGGVLIVQDPAEARGPGGNNKGQPGKAASGKGEAPRKDPVPRRRSTDPPAGAPVTKSGVMLPSLADLAKRCLKAFNLAAGVIGESASISPALPADQNGGDGLMESEAKRLEAEAALIEAQARKLEAETRKFEAEARMAKAKKGLEE